MRQHLLQTLELALKYGLSDNIPMIKMNLSNAEARLNNFGKAIDYLIEVIPFYVKKNNQYALGLAYANLSWCYYKSDKLNNALEFARKSYQIRTLLKDAAGLAHLDLNFSKIYLGLAKYDSASIYAQSALKKCRELHLVNDIRDNYETLAKLSEQQKNYPAAVEYYRLFADWKDSVNNYEKEKLVEQELQKIKYDTVQHLKQNLMVEHTTKKQLQLWIWLLAGTIVCMVGIGIAGYRNLQQRVVRKEAGLQNSDIAGEQIQKLKRQMTEQAEQFENTKADLKQQNTELLTAKNELQVRLEKLESAGIKELQELIESDKLHSDGYWNEFLVLFSRVYPEFFKNLKAAHPDLTQHELRICAMIKLNHNVADTAKVLNITVESVRKVRYRLYKKMGLQNDQELVDTIIQS